MIYITKVQRFLITGALCLWAFFPGILYAGQNTSISLKPLKTLGDTTLRDSILLANIPSEPRYHKLIVRAAKRYDLEPALIRAIIRAESSYNPRAVSRSGAKGLMQLMPKTARSLGVKDSFDPADNIEGGSKYFSRLLKRFNGSTRLALAAYNAGTANVLRHKGVPPFRATKIYIKKVMKYYQQYKAQGVNNAT